MVALCNTYVLYVLSEWFPEDYLVALLPWPKRFPMQRSYSRKASFRLLMVCGVFEYPATSPLSTSSLRPTNPVDQRETSLDLKSVAHDPDLDSESMSRSSRWLPPLRVQGHHSGPESTGPRAATIAFQ